jgi:hypothetical protein
MATVLRLRRGDGSELEAPIADVTAESVLSAVPWRTFRSHRRQPYLSGYYWSSTTGGHVIYESRLELARLLLADVDPEVVGIAAQPFLVIADGRRHVPDFFLVRRSGPALVVNVKPAERLSDPKVAEALGWAGAVFADRGWDHEIWSGSDAQLLANVRFLAGYRRTALLDPEVLATARQRLSGRFPLADAEAELAAAGLEPARPVLLHLVWSGFLRADLGGSFDGSTMVEVA